MAKSPQTRTKTPSRGAPKLPRLPGQLRKAIAAASDRKAEALTVLDLRQTGAFTDYFLICTGANPRQVHAIADAIEQSLKADKVRPAHVEGYDRAEWVLLDYFDFIVHVFSVNARQFYGLERLWGEARRIEIPDPTAQERQARA